MLNDFVRSIEERLVKTLIAPRAMHKSAQKRTPRRDVLGRRMPHEPVMEMALSPADDPRHSLQNTVRTAAVSMGERPVP